MVEINIFFEICDGVDDLKFWCWDFYVYFELVF